jgi:murein DD-endopeptidase MepM/ murein hydrolase activator NlpD
MQFNGDNTTTSQPAKTARGGVPYLRAGLPYLALGLLLILSMLACSLGARTSADPIFTPPNGQGVHPTADSQKTAPTLSADPAEATLTSTEAATPDEPTAVPTSTNTPTPSSTPTSSAPYLYYTQAGDTLPVVAIRFGVQPAEISSPDPLPQKNLLPPNQLLIIPRRLANTTSSQHLLPDSEVVFSPSAMDFDVAAYVKQAGGYLASYHNFINNGGEMTGADIILRVARDNSINPRLLLAILEYQSGWVLGQPGNLAQSEYPLGMIDPARKGLYNQLMWAVSQLSVGFYGWREGLLTEITFPDGVTARLAPDLNAGSVALLYYFAKVYDTQTWAKMADINHGLPALHERMFGSPWVRAMGIEPLYPPDLTQPPLILPFVINQVWALTGGPHGAWEHDGALAALDFAPGSTESGCVKSDMWVVAAAAGKVVRSEYGIVVLDMDGDGYEQTGWDILYLHIASDGRVALGAWVEKGDLIGHPSCEGGEATGTHVHIARKYNGEWIPADGPIPFNLDGWIAHAGGQPYLGSLTRGDQTVTASQVGSYESVLRRTP